MTLTEPAPAKVNLTLRVTGRRPDGYHLLDSLVVFGPALDYVQARPAPGLSLDVTGPFAAGLHAEPDNLVLKAARVLAAWADRPADAALTLQKNMPVASGIGGGSADAAAALRVLCRLWKVVPSVQDMARLSAALGADVPACLMSVPLRMSGVGEVLAPIPRPPPCGLLLTNPGIAVATAAVFGRRTAAFSARPAAPAGWPDVIAMAADLKSYGNDLEPPARAVAPVIDAALAALRALPGCLLARMSGSGATCFGLFADPAAAVRGGAGLPAAWWRCAGPLYEPAPATL